MLTLSDFLFQIFLTLFSAECSVSKKLKQEQSIHIYICIYSHTYTCGSVCEKGMKRDSFVSSFLRQRRVAERGEREGGGGEEEEVD